MKILRYNILTICILFIISSFTIIGCSKIKDRPEEINLSVNVNEIESIENDDKEEENMVLRDKLENLFKNIQFTNPYKLFTERNPLITQSYGADPYGMVYGDRLYVYMTHDAYMYDGEGNISNNTYSTIKSLRCISSADLVNWTDHGVIHVGGLKGATTWANNSWAPAAIHKNIDGEDKFFIYFANSASSIGVLTADSPIGPFRDPLGEPIITRETPNCSDVTWLFDPAVFTDDDGKSYIYFGGGVPEGKSDMPKTSRVIELGNDMISTVGEAVTIEAPYIFEDSGINKIGDTYYYSYCSNWDSRDNAKGEYVPAIAEIIYMTSDNPMGPWQYQGSILENPGKYFGSWGNNHHCIVEFNKSYYMLYHTQLLQDSIGVSGGYRSTHINEIKVNSDGSLQKVIPTKSGVDQLKYFNPYETVQATTMSRNGGVNIFEHTKKSYKEPQIVSIGEIDNGDWLQVSGVDFGDKGAGTLTIRYSCEGDGGAIRVCIDKLDGKVIAYAEITNTGDSNTYIDVSVPVQDITGVHELYFEFVGSGYLLNSWSFNEK